MSAGTPTNSGEMKMLPGAAPPVESARGDGARGDGTRSAITVTPVAPSSPVSSGPAAPQPAAALSASAIVAGTLPTRQLSELPRDELDHLAEEYGLDPPRFKTRQH